MQEKDIYDKMINIPTSDYVTCLKSWPFFNLHPQVTDHVLAHVGYAPVLHCLWEAPVYKDLSPDFSAEDFLSTCS